MTSKCAGKSLLVLNALVFLPPTSRNRIMKRRLKVTATKSRILCHGKSSSWLILCVGVKIKTKAH